MPRYRRREPVLYCRVDDKIVAAKYFLNIRVRERPLVRCLITGDRVSIKAGPKVVPHVARYEKGARSSASRQTARHINAKGHFHETARTADTLVVLATCAGAPDGSGRVRPCTNKIRVLAAWDWTDVRMEVALNNRRPDGQVICGDHSAVLLEFRAENPVGWEKALDLAVLDAPTLEIDADPAFFDGDSAWTANKPLLVNKVHPIEFAPRCPEHVLQYRAHCERRFGISGPLYRPVDVYQLADVHWRTLFRVDVQVEGPDERLRWTLRQDGQAVASLVRSHWDGAQHMMETMFDAALGSIQRRYGAVVRTPDRWLPYSELAVFSPAYLYDTALWPPRRR